ncbi:SRPBCC family protein [Rhodococcus sp. HNM0569]|uniref:SRPBCC family protein n=1 Tax=Rhodococcus sp. HNM0569 TaxID=2716340 RepID=UPI00146E661A|nr:SRPBCC family protein [Rhodococcus sp. HNM0569]NLU83676.1 SRPBCC family protein [Rhodococcus sp. HNM0569]
MTPGKHRLAPVDDAFFARARVAATVVTEFSVPRETVWRALVADDSVQAWSRVATRARWHGSLREVGAVRDVTLAGAVTLTEEFYRWDDGHRLTFGVPSVNLPLFSRFGEDFVLDGTPAGSRLTWTVATDPRGPRFVDPVLRAILATSLRDLSRGLVRVVRDSGDGVQSGHE